MATSGASGFKWTAGLINSEGKYLTSEKFQFKVNANGLSLKKKQTWTLEKASENEVAIRSCFGRYLASDKDGKVTADSESVEGDNKFELVTQDDGTLAIKTSSGRYFSGSGDLMSGFDTSVKQSNKWKLQLALMPQMNLRNVNRKTYAHLQDDEICANEDVPWGHDATISIDYHNGKYSIRASNRKYLSGSGSLKDNLDDDCLFILAIKGDQVAFRDKDGKYLAGVGPNAKLQSRKTAIGKDELFTLEDTNPQFTLVASNKKYVSTLQGTDLRANQFDVKDSEIFQMQAVDRTDLSGSVKWAISSKKKKYWIVNDKSNLECTAADFNSPEAQYTVEWKGPIILLKAYNDKYVAVKSGGQLAANNTDKDETSQFVFQVLNHPIITLRSEHGFVGVKPANKMVECSRSQYDVFNLICADGTYKFSDACGKFWEVEGNAIFCKGDKGADFFIEFRAHSRICIVCSNGQYMKGDHNGAFTCNGGDQIKSDTLWEF